MFIPRHQESVARPIHKRMDKHVIRRCLFATGHLHHVGSLLYAVWSVLHDVSIPYHHNKLEVIIFSILFNSFYQKPKTWPFEYFHREQILTMKDENNEAIINTLATMPAALESEDVMDFCSLAQYYALKTPSSFKQDLYAIMFGKGGDDKLITHALCLPVTAQELVENSVEIPSGINSSTESVKFFLVDCRPADQYNAGHLPTAFHLDCNLVSCSIFHLKIANSNCKFFVVDAARANGFWNCSSGLVASTTSSLGSGISRWRWALVFPWQWSTGRGSLHSHGRCVVPSEAHAIRQHGSFGISR